MLREVIDYLVAQKNAQWIDGKGDRCVVLWKKPEEWAACVYQWVVNTGRTNTVCTSYEIVNGDESIDEGEI